LPIITRYAAKRNGHNRLSEDIAQEVFFRVWQDRAKYQPKSAFKTFLFTYAKNVFYEHKSKSSREILLSDADYSDLVLNDSEAVLPVCQRVNP
jgi:DNA-directed RNA polymerase specialized sigma24 family protein